MSGAASSPLDVLVVGAGPAGSVTAMQLARSGHRVLLLDRRAFPRAKPCGDCLSPEAARVLDRLGVLSAVAALRPARLRGWRIWSPDGQHFEGGFERAARGDVRVESSMALDRERLDDALLRAALEAGADLLEGVRVEQLLFADDAVQGAAARDTDGRGIHVRARIVIGADGLRSVVARRAGAIARPGRLRKLSFTSHPRLPAGFTDGRGEMHVIDGGCVGIAPLASGDPAVHNVTCVTDAATRGPAARNDPAAMVEAMIGSAPGLAERAAILLAALRACGPPLASGPFDRPTRFVVRDGLALVGDAAGYYDPFTGQGVFQALVGAERLAAVADGALRARSGGVRGDALRSYARWVARRRRSALRVQRAIEFVTARPRLMNRFAVALERTPSFADALIATTGDLTPPRALAGPPLAELSLALFRMGMSR